MQTHKYRFTIFLSTLSFASVGIAYSTANTSRLIHTSKRLYFFSSHSYIKRGTFLFDLFLTLFFFSSSITFVHAKHKTYCLTGAHTNLYIYTHSPFSETNRYQPYNIRRMCLSGSKCGMLPKHARCDSRRLDHGRTDKTSRKEIHVLYPGRETRMLQVLPGE